MISQPFNRVGPTQNITVTATSAGISLGGNAAYAETLRFVNVGTQTVFVEFSSDGVTPTATLAASIPILPNTSLIVTNPRTSNVAAIAGATGSTLYVTPGIGG